LFIYRPRRTLEAFLIEQWLRHQEVKVSFELTLDESPLEYFEEVYKATDMRLYESILAYRSGLEQVTMQLKLLQEAENNEKLPRKQREELISERSQELLKVRAVFEVLRSAVIINRFLEHSAREACKHLKAGSTLATVWDTMKFYSRLMQKVTVRPN